METLLTVSHLNVDFYVKTHRVRIIDDVSFEMRRGEVLAIIGETGCGKSVTGNTILKLLPENAVVQGKIIYDGQDILHMSEREFRKLRGNEIMNVAQNPVAALDPLMRVGSQVQECLTLKYKPEKSSKSDIKHRVDAAFEKLGLRQNMAVAKRYPCELSGGMCQRVLISMGMVTHPQLLVVDEPTKAIDWALRKRVAEIFNELNKDMGCSMLVITHDIPFADTFADRIAVMYAGQIVEIGPTKDVLHSPAHPYTQGLIASMPTCGFTPMKGSMPSFDNVPDGCRFAPRCLYRNETCNVKPSWHNVSPAHFGACVHAAKVYESETNHA